MPNYQLQLCLIISHMNYPRGKIVVGEPIAIGAKQMIHNKTKLESNPEMLAIFKTTASPPRT